MIAMNIRKHISHRRQSERVISMRHKRILSLEINRKLSLQDIATRNIDKQMENIQKELTEMRNPSRSRQRKKQYKFPVTSPVWKRNKPPQGTHSNNTRRDVLLLKSFDDDDDDDDDSNDDEDSIKQRDAYRRWSTSETLLLFNNDDQNDNTAAFNRKNSQLIPSKESTFNPNSILINSNLVPLDNKTNNLRNFKQTENLIGLSTDPSCQSGITEKPLVIFSPEKTSTIVGQFVQGNNAAKKAKDIGNLQPVTEELPQSGTLLPLPPVRHDGAAAAVIELPEQSPSPTRIFGLRSTADVCTSLPVAITQEGKQQANSYLQNNLIVGDGRETDRNRRGKNHSYHNNNNYPGEASEADPNNSVCNSQHESLFAGNPDFATLARTSMSSIKKDIARRLSSTAVPTGLNKLQCQKNSGTMQKNRLNPEQSSHKNAIPGSGSNQLLVPRRENDKRRKSEGGEILGATASLRRLSLYTPREPHPRQEMPNAAVATKSPELDTGLRVNKPKEEKPRRKSYLKSLPVYDRELYNPDGSLRTVYCLPSFNESWQQAQQARYIRTREAMDRDKELSVEEVFAKHENKNDNTGAEESGTEKQMQ